MIVGGFNIFGHCQGGNHRHYLTVEVRYPSGDPNNGYKTMRWDVTDQMHDPLANNHIIIDWDTVIISTGSEDANIDAKVEPWEDVWIPVEI